MSARVIHISNEEMLNLFIKKNSKIEFERDHIDAYERTTLLLDFRGVTGNTKAIEKKSAKLQREIPNVQLCKVDPEGNVWIEIRSEQDYAFFFLEFIKNGKLKKEYEKSKFAFYIYLENIDNQRSADEQRLYFYYLIANRYKDNHFDLTVFLQKENESGEDNKKWLEDNYYRLCIYSRIQTLYCGLGGVVRIGKEKKEHSLTRGEYIGKISPVFTIDSDSLMEFSKPISKELWVKIQTLDEVPVNNIEGVLKTLCQRYLFKQLDMPKQLHEIREKTFQSPDFFRAIEGIPMLALLIFAEVDYYSRMEMINEYRSCTNIKRIGISDLLDDYQSQQNYKGYAKHMNMVKDGMNIKSMLTRQQDFDSERRFSDICEDINKDIKNEGEYRKELYKIYNLHTHIITEIYEAVSIAEGLLQLIDNVVTHAGCGVMSMRIHCKDDKSVLKERYLSYFLLRDHKPQTKYFLEVRISDLSGSNISDKFKSNYPEFGAELSEKEKIVFDNFSLDSFFNPSEKEQQVWDLFYKKSQNIVNHYGLQIFESIIRSKDGYFTVTSGDKVYRSEKSMSERENLSLVYPGTSYTILMPLDNKVAEDKNIYDSMFAYDVCNYLKKDKINEYLLNFEYRNRDIPSSVSEKREFYDRVCKETQEKIQEENSIAVVDMDRIFYLEGIVKGIMLYLFCEKEKKPQKKIYIAFVNCKTYQIVEIVRLVSLSYDKAGRNSRMNNVQIYIRGKNIGEEIIFFGNTLTEVGNNIMKLACMRGTLFDNSQAVYTLLKRK